MSKQKSTKVNFVYRVDRVKVNKSQHHPYKGVDYVYPRVDFGGDRPETLIL